MASSLRTKLRIAYNVLCAPGFFDALAGRFLWSTAARAAGIAGDDASPYADLSGALHIHTTYSDGAGDVERVMDAAKNAGVDFVLLCDHNTMAPLQDGWEERYATETPFLMIGTELTVQDGRFLLALDAPPTYEPKRGVPAQEGIDAIRAAGAMPLISLPFDMKHPFEDWSVGGYDGLEVLNFSTTARRHINFLSLLWLLPVGWLGGTEAVLRAMVSRPDAALDRWDSLTKGGERRIVGIGALDAHAQMKIGAKKYGLPSYEDSFRAVRTHVLIPPGEADPKRRIALVNDAIRAGRCYFSFDCLAIPTHFRFSATNERTGAAAMGERLTVAANDTVCFSASFGPEVESHHHILLRLYEGGRPVAESTGGVLTARLPARPGAYRIEAYRYSGRIAGLFFGVRPWVWSNPIYVTVQNPIHETDDNRE